MNVMILDILKFFVDTWWTVPLYLNPNSLPKSIQAITTTQCLVEAGYIG
jgi:hypothetical protein